MPQIKKVGLALGAGSVKGFAHIGVLQILEENKIPVHMVSGSSVGAIVGAIYSVGGDMDMLAKYFSSISSKGFLDVPRPQRSGLMSGEKLEELIRIFTHNKDFENTNIPFFCTAVDIETGELLTLHTGKLYTAVRASMSIPGIFEPVRLDGRLCVDGGVLDCVPCSQLKQAGADVVIGVDVGWRGEPERMESPTLLSIVDRSTTIMQSEITKLRTGTADVLICPRVPYMRWFATENAKMAIEEGRRAATEMLPQICSALKEQGIALQNK